MSTNVVMPHPDDAWLHHDDYLLWRHSGYVPEVGSVAQEVAKVVADFWIARWLLVLQHCGFRTPRAFPHQLIGCGRAIVDTKCKMVDNWGIISRSGGIVCEKVSHHQGMCDWWDNVWDPLLEPMESMGLKKVEYGRKERGTETVSPLHWGHGRGSFEVGKSSRAQIWDAFLELHLRCWVWW